MLTFKVEKAKYMPRVCYQIYVVELSKKVFIENAKFRAANPQFNGVLECLFAFVGVLHQQNCEQSRKS
jgi:hypothetical protein